MPRQDNSDLPDQLSPFGPLGITSPQSRPIPRKRFNGRRVSMGDILRLSNLKTHPCIDNPNAILGAPSVLNSMGSERCQKPSCFAFAN